MGIGKKIDENTKVFTALLVLGIIGLLFLIVFGNLQGNLGFESTQTNFVNETSFGFYAVNATTVQLLGTNISGFESLTVSEVYSIDNGTIGFNTAVVVGTGNYTVDGTAGTIAGVVAAGSFNFTNINITYAVTHKQSSEVDSDNVIGNLTSGAVVFFSFANVWFTLLAITLLIIIIISVIKVASSASGAGDKGGAGGRGSNQFPD